MVAWFGLLVAVMSFGIAAVSLGWQIRTHRQSRAERVEARISEKITTGGHFLRLTVVNACERSVYVRKVEFVAKHVEQEKEMDFQRTFRPATVLQGKSSQEPAVPSKSIHASTQMPFRAAEDTSAPLEPGQERPYFLSYNATEKLLLAKDLPLIESLWITVASPKGELVLAMFDVLGFNSLREERGTPGGSAWLRWDSPAELIATGYSSVGWRL